MKTSKRTMATTTTTTYSFFEPRRTIGVGVFNSVNALITVHVFLSSLLLTGSILAKPTTTSLALHGASREQQPQRVLTITNRRTSLLSFLNIQSTNNQRKEKMIRLKERPTGAKQFIHPTAGITSTAKVQCLLSSNQYHQPGHQKQQRQNQLQRNRHLFLSTTKTTERSSLPLLIYSHGSLSSSKAYFILKSTPKDDDLVDSNSEDEVDIVQSKSLSSSFLEEEESTSLMNTTTATTVSVYQQRWIQLGYLSLLAFISDWICFSVAAVPDAFEMAFPSHSAASIIDLFLFTNVVSCFLVTDVVRTIGLQASIHGSAVLMTIGCWLRCGGISFLESTPSVLVSYPNLVVGTIMVGFAQPFFQCTPPLLSATWFPPSERATSTAIALNFNQVGIATAFLVGGVMAVTSSGIENYFGLIAIICTVITIGTLIQFKNEPPTPPSQSELEKKAKQGSNNIEDAVPPFITSATTFFKTNGFSQALVAFICSISITNVVGAFIDDILGGYFKDQKYQVDIAGAGFELAIVLGGILIGGYVDKTKQYKSVTIACLVTAAIFVLPLGVEMFVPSMSDDSNPAFYYGQPWLLLFSLIGLGLVVGPVQPISAELAVDVTYPGDETAVESVQQIGGNMISAILIPIAEWLKKQGNVQLQLILPTLPFFIPNTNSVGNGYDDNNIINKVVNAATGITINNSNIPTIEIGSDILMLFVLTIATIAYYSTFNAPLARSNADEE